MAGRCGGMRLKPLRVLLAGLLIPAIVSCAPAGGVPSHPVRARARADCQTVGRALGGPPQAHAFWFRRVLAMPGSGFGALDAASARLKAALRAGDSAAVDRAVPAVIRDCGRLGLWSVYQ